MFAPLTLLAFLFACLLVLSHTSALASEGRDRAYLADLTQRAKDLKLAQQRVWLLLGHYRRDLLGGYTSEADDPGFFLAQDGRTDPQAEMEATLAYFSPEAS